MGIGGALSRWLRVPIRALRCAGDLYVQSIICCARRLRYEGAGINGYEYSDAGYGFDSTKVNNERDDEHRKPIRAAKKAKRRQSTVTMATIDEDEACELVKDARISSNLLLPKGRSSFKKQGIRNS